MNEICRFRQRALAAFGLSAWALLALGAEGIGELDFRQPPAWARPWVVWFWVDGNVTREGITADLEAMERVGIGGALLMDVTQDFPAGPVKFGTRESEGMFQHTIAEAHRLGLSISLHNGPGWSGSGGPWVTPELSMQRVFWSRTNVAGPGRFRGRLPPVGLSDQFQRDIATVAFPTIVGDGVSVPGLQPVITTSAGAAVTNAGPSGLSGTPISVPVATARRPQYVQLKFPRAFTASRLRLDGGLPAQSFRGSLQVSDDGRSFRTVREFMSVNGGLAVEFEMVSARYYRILFVEAAASFGRLEFRGIELVPVMRIANYALKSGMGRWSTGRGQTNTPSVPEWARVNLDKTCDLSGKVGADGTLDWEIPEGDWTILRFGSLPTGQRNHPAPPGGEGLECDKLSRTAIEAHFDAYLGHLAKLVAGSNAPAFAAAHVDSWEVGYQDWTPTFREEFRRRRGYDLVSWLPVLGGRVVGDSERSERFLWDMRRTIADLVADNYAGRLAELAGGRGMQLSIEAYGMGPFDGLQVGTRATVPMAEFWVEDIDFGRFSHCKTMSSAAHMAGRRVVAAEAFTAHANYGRWLNHPFSLKPLGDAAFCEGVNRFVFHRYAHQPWLDRMPGMTLGPWGIHYERTETWWEQTRPWHEYVTRCQWLLQSGRFIADVAYLVDEGAFHELPLRRELQPRLPAGYDYDLITPEVLLSGASVKQGRLELAHGMNYGLLVLPEQAQMTPQLLRKVKELVAAGLAVIGPAPAGSPSLSGYPACDAEVRGLAAELWGPCDGRAVRERVFGKGRVFLGKPLDEVLLQTGQPPDFLKGDLRFDQSRLRAHPPASPPPANPLYALKAIHRQVGSAEVYFVANSNAQPVIAECGFRVTGKAPELWQPETGEVRPLPQWRLAGEHTLVPLRFGPAEAYFIVFREHGLVADPVVSVMADPGEAAAELVANTQGEVSMRAQQPGVYRYQTRSGRTLQAEVERLPESLAVTGPWELAFPPGRGAPATVTIPRLSSWHTQADAGVKYFSGTAAYTKSFSIEPGCLKAGRHWILDLGEVQVIAELKVNGRDFGVLWHPPFEADVTDALTAGTNRLEIRVTNLWPNRLIGDEQLPEDCEWRTPWTDTGVGLAKWPDWLTSGEPRPTSRVTFTTWKHWTKDGRLLESGLLGPVSLRPVEERLLK